MAVREKISLKELYEVDDSLWIEETVKLLQEKKFSELDLDNLIEELEDLGNEKKLAVKSLLQQTIIHLLLLNYWDREYERNHGHWLDEVYGFRYQLNDRLTINLTKYLEENLAKTYERALKRVNNKTNHSLNLPKECPYTLDQLLNEDWFPKE